MKKGIYIPLLIIFIWQVGSFLHLFNSYIIPPPVRVFETAWFLIKSGALLKHISVSMFRVFLGFTITFCLAFSLGIVIAVNKSLQDLLSPLLEFIRHIPPIALIPMLILWFGIGEMSKLAVIILATFFPIFLNTVGGVLSCDIKFIEVGKVFKFDAKRRFLKIILPAALPSIIVGMRLGLGYSWRALIGAELIAASSGIGYMIIDAEQLSRPDIIIVGILTIGIMGYLIDFCFLKISRRVIPWLGREVEANGRSRY